MAERDAILKRHPSGARVVVYGVVRLEGTRNPTSVTLEEVEREGVVQTVRPTEQEALAALWGLARVMPGCTLVVFSESYMAVADA